MSDHEEIEVEFYDETDEHPPNPDVNEAHPKSEKVEEVAPPKEEEEEIEEVENIEPVEEIEEEPAIEKVQSWNDSSVKAAEPSELENEEIEEFEEKEDVKVNPKGERIQEHRVGGGFLDSFAGGNLTGSSAQENAIQALERDEHREIEDEKAKKIAETEKQKRPKGKTADADNCLVALIAWLYSLIACCNPLLPPPRKRSRGSTRDREIPQLGELFHSDTHIREIFADAEYMVKECYVREAGGGNLDNLKLTVVSYRILKDGGFHYFTKIKINDGDEFVHARIFKAGRGKAVLMGELQLGKSKDDEIKKF